MAQQSNYIFNEKLFSFVFGVVFLSIILAIAVLVPNPTGFSYTIFRIVIALAAAGIGAVIPGMISVSYKNVLRASGAVALFVIVYFAAPAAIGEGSVPTPPEPRSNAKVVALSWLKAVDQGKYIQAYEKTTTHFKRSYAQNDTIDLIKSTRASMGEMVNRQVDATSNAVNPPGQNRGYYQTYGFKTKYSNEINPIYETVNLYGENGEWRVAGFFVFQKNDQGMIVPYSTEN